ncbi:hypothetical protein D3C86_1289400 [compost metagenome]
MAEQRIAIERHLGVENAQMAIFHDDQRVNLEESHVLLIEGLVEDREQRLGVFRSNTLKLERLGDRGNVGVAHTLFRVDGDGVDFLGRVVGDSFDIHTAFGGNHESNLADGTVNQQRAVEFAGNVCAVFDVETVDLLAGVARLRRYQRVAEHVLGVGNDFVDRLCQTNAALGVGAEFLELALAAAASVDLALDDVERAGKLLCGSFGFFDLENGDAFSNRRAVALQKSLGLIFVNIHGIIPVWSR